MRPRQKNRGSLPLQAGHAGMEGAASMRPRQKNRGRADRFGGGYSGGARFNVAARKKPRKGGNFVGRVTNGRGASMRPRQKNRGSSDWVNWSYRLNRCCFNEAAAKKPRKSSSRRSVLRRIARFNEAAAKKPRKSARAM